VEKGESTNVLESSNILKECNDFYRFSLIHLFIKNLKPGVKPFLG
jgi:hypothetical protein